MKYPDPIGDFLWRLWNDSRETPDYLIDYQEAEADLRNFRNEWDDVPEDLTPDEYMTFRNWQVLKACETVRRNWKCLPTSRANLMSDREIAMMLREAHDWDEVIDLCDFVLEELFGDDGESWRELPGHDLERAIEDWCDEQLED